VLQISEGRAEVLYDGAPTWVAVRGIPDLRVGEYLVVYAGQALDRIPNDEAEEMLRFYDALERMLEEAVG
jgi:hydrogenase maturation factor